jgi:hypothetical protein
VDRADAAASAGVDGEAQEMRFAFYGLLSAALLFLVSGGHVLFLPLFFLLPLGGMLAIASVTGTSGTGGEGDEHVDCRRFCPSSGLGAKRKRPSVCGRAVACRSWREPERRG